MTKYTTFIITLLVLLSSCGFNAPPDYQKFASMIVEVDWMPNYSLQDQEFANRLFSFKKVYDVYDEVGIESQFQHDSEPENRLVSYNTFNPDYFYTGFSGVDRDLREYASHFDNEDFSWHLLCVDRLAANQFRDLPVLGATIFDENNPNHPIQTDTERGSFIFTQDIIDRYEDLNDTYGIISGLEFTTIHELGHQRAGLTDVAGHEQYHDMNTLCVMGGTLTESPHFCKDTSGPNVSSCLTNIKANYGVF